jgi:hypothetical protein
MLVSQRYGDEWERGERLDFWNWPRRWEGVGNPKKECMKLPGELGAAAGETFFVRVPDGSYYQLYDARGPVEPAVLIPAIPGITRASAQAPNPPPLYLANEAWRYSGPGHTAEQR